MAGRRFAYNELGEDNPVVVDEDEIRRTYYPHWLDQMTRARERGQPNALASDMSWEDCLMDFQVVNWAWELKDAESDLHGV